MAVHVGGADVQVITSRLSQTSIRLVDQRVELGRQTGVQVCWVLKGEGSGGVCLDTASEHVLLLLMLISYTGVCRYIVE